MPPDDFVCSSVSLAAGISEPHGGSWGGLLSPSLHIVLLAPAGRRGELSRIYEGLVGESSAESVISETIWAE